MNIIRDRDDYVNERELKNLGVTEGMNNETNTALLKKG
jgi:hypothetical protein